MAVVHCPDLQKMQNALVRTTCTSDFVAHKPRWMLGVVDCVCVSTFRIVNFSSFLFLCPLSFDGTVCYAMSIVNNKYKGMRERDSTANAIGFIPRIQKQRQHHPNTKGNCAVISAIAIVISTSAICTINASNRVRVQ